MPALLLVLFIVFIFNAVLLAFIATELSSSTTDAMELFPFSRMKRVSDLLEKVWPLYWFRTQELDGDTDNQDKEKNRLKQAQEKNKQNN